MLWRSPSPSLQALYDQSEAGLFGLKAEDFAAILAQVEAKYLGEHPAARKRASFRKNLKIRDLVLARACARGHEGAWEQFWLRYRERLHAAARSITREPALAGELADGLFGDLFGLRMRDGARVSKLDSYMGLGSLEGWLFTLLAQAHVDHWRRERRQVSLDESDHLQTLLVPPNQTGGSEGGGPGTTRQRLETAMETVLREVGDQPKLLLSLYFLEGQTLAQIGRFLQVHESTVSRRLDKTLVHLRRLTLRELRRMGMQRPAADEALHMDPRLLRIDVRKCLRTAGGPEEVH